MTNFEWRRGMEDHDNLNTQPYYPNQSPATHDYPESDGTPWDGRMLDYTDDIVPATSQDHEAKIRAAQEEEAL